MTHKPTFDSFPLSSALWHSKCHMCCWCWGSWLRWRFLQCVNLVCCVILSVYSLQLFNTHFKCRTDQDLLYLYLWLMKKYICELDCRLYTIENVSIMATLNVNLTVILFEILSDGNRYFSWQLFSLTSGYNFGLLQVDSVGVNVLMFERVRLKPDCSRTKTYHWFPYDKNTS